MSDSLTLSFFGIAVIALAVLAAFSVRPRWRLAALLLVTVVWCMGAGLRGESPWPGSFETRALCLLTAALAAVFSKRFAFMFPAVLLLWCLGAWEDSAPFSVSHAIRNLHRLSVVGLAGIGLAGFSQFVSLGWHFEPFRPREAELHGAGWKGVSIATGLLLVVLILTVTFELAYRAEPLGLEAPLGLLVALAESLAGICLWRATVQTSQIEERQVVQRPGVAPVGWITMVGLMVVFVLTGLAFALVPVIVAAA